MRDQEVIQASNNVAADDDVAELRNWIETALEHNRLVRMGKTWKVLPCFILPCSVLLTRELMHCPLQLPTFLSASHLPA